MAGQFELKKSDTGQFMFNLKASNGQIILTSQRYQAKDSAKDGIESVRKQRPTTLILNARASGGEPYFVVKAANGQVIGTSEMYSSTAAMESGIASVKANAPSAPIADSTV